MSQISNLNIAPFEGAGVANQLFAKDPLRRFYNLDGLTDVFLTCDVDWAPDYAIEMTLREIEKRGQKLTIFTTHDSAALKNPPLWLEVGLHPDFTRRHPAPWFDERMATLKALYPDAVGMRSHRNFFGQNIGDLARTNGLVYDVSTVLWNEPFCQAHRDYNGIVRFAYCWEDGLHLDLHPTFDFSGIRLNTPGMKILNVHPIAVFLNPLSEAMRKPITNRYNDLTCAPRDELQQDVFSGVGIATLWKALLDWLVEHNIRTHCLRDAAALLENVEGDWQCAV
jgi:hypothetical protein